jgi:hypothetical protein
MFSLRAACAACVMVCFVVSGCGKDNNKKQKFAVEEGCLELERGGYASFGIAR